MDLGALSPAALEYWQLADEYLQDGRDFTAAGKHRWAITALFYSALHRLNAYLTQEVRRPTSHDLRDRLIALELPEVADYYLALKQRSERARYWPDAQMTALDAEAALAQEYQIILDGVTARMPD